jgi:uncharacterized protein (DUF1800 family)
LDDKDSIVSQSAMKSLVRFGIDSADKLRNEMINLRLLPKFYDMVPYVSKLDIMLARLQAQNSIRCDNESINRWYQSHD